MEAGKLMDMVEVFEGLEDWRNAQQTRHRLSELLTIAVCAVLSGADDFVGIEEWAKLKLDWLRGFMKLEQGIPSHDTLARVFGLISPDEFEAAFRRWVGMVIPALAQDTVVAIDGKTSRRSHNKKDTDAHPLHGGQEFVFVHTGTVVLDYGDQIWTLSAGDSAYFDASISHRMRSVGAERAEVVVVTADESGAQR